MFFFHHRLSTTSLFNVVIYKTFLYIIFSSVNHLDIHVLVSLALVTKLTFNPVSTISFLWLWYIKFKDLIMARYPPFFPVVLNGFVFVLTLSEKIKVDVFQLLIIIIKFKISNMMRLFQLILISF